MCIRCYTISNNDHRITVLELILKMHRLIEYNTYCTSVPVRLLPIFIYPIPPTNSRTDYNINKLNRSMLVRHNMIISLKLYNNAFMRCATTIKQYFIVSYFHKWPSCSVIWKSHKYFALRRWCKTLPFDKIYCRL